LWLVVGLNAVATGQVASVEQGPQGTDKPEPIGQIDVKWLHKFEHEQAKLFNDFNASVPAEAQELYNELKKMYVRFVHRCKYLKKTSLPVEWKGQKIVLFGGDATIEPPYTQLQGDTSIMSLATKVVLLVNCTCRSTNTHNTHTHTQKKKKISWKR